MHKGLSDLARHVRTKDPDRFYAALFAPAEARDALFALLAFNYEVARVGEIVSEPKIGEMRLQWWRDAIGALGAGRAPPAHPVAEALGAAWRQRPFSLASLAALIDAREHDLAAAPLADMEALEKYAQATGGGLHRAMAETLRADGDGIRAAEAAGTGWAITGILRTLPVWEVRRRIFLPEDLLRRYDLTQADIASGAKPDATHAAVREILRRARWNAWLARQITPGVALPAVLVAWLVPAYADGIVRSATPVTHQRAPSRPERIVRLALAAWRARG